MRVDRRAHRLAGARRRAAWPTRRALPAEDALGLAAGQAREGAVVDRRADAAAHRQFRRSRSAARRARRRAGVRRAGRADPGATPTSSSCRARRRRIADLGFLRAQGWDIDILAHAPARRAGAGPVRRLPDARASASPTRTASRARPARSRGSACSTSRRRSPRTSGSRRSRARRSARRAALRLRDAYRRDDRPGGVAAALSRDLAKAGPTVPSPPTGASSAPTSTGCFADDRQRAALASLPGRRDERSRL